VERFFEAVAFVTGQSREWKMDLVDVDDCASSLIRDLAACRKRSSRNFCDLFSIVLKNPETRIINTQDVIPGFFVPQNPRLTHGLP
jgi:hypothetical protein